jgi:hypothetical protein
MTGGRTSGPDPLSAPGPAQAGFLRGNHITKGEQR